jgi:hypothetical protein
MIYITAFAQVVGIFTAYAHWLLVLFPTYGSFVLYKKVAPIIQGLLGKKASAAAPPTATATTTKR